MSRPANADADATRRRILERARGLFSNGAAGDVSVRQIARAAGVSVAMIHHYYGSKDGLYAACVASMYEDLAGVLQAVGASLRDPRSVGDVLPSAARDAFRFARSRRPLIRFLIRHMVDGGSAPADGEERLRLFLSVFSQHLGALSGRDPSALRLPLQSILFLVARYAAQEDEALCLSTGVEPGDVDGACAAVEAHLADAARTMLVPPTK